MVLNENTGTVFMNIGDTPYKSFPPVLRNTPIKYFLVFYIEFIRFKLAIGTLNVFEE